MPGIDFEQGCNKIQCTMKLKTEIIRIVSSFKLRQINHECSITSPVSHFTSERSIRFGFLEEVI